MSALEIGDYVARARANPTTDNLEALWRAVFLLKAWYFLPAGTQEGPATPLVTAIDGQYWLLAFTNVRRLKEFALSVGRTDPRGDPLLLVLDPLESMEHILQVRENIAGVVFNIASDETFRTTVEGLEQSARGFGLPLP